LDQLYEKWKIDAVLSICAPFSAHVAGYRFTRKHPEIRFVTYTADPYSANLVQNCSKMTRGYKCRRAKKWEKKIYGSSQCNLVFEGIAADEETYSMFPAHNSHLLYYQFPEFFPRTLSEETIKMKIIYAGGFYPTIRNPEYALKTFCGIKNFAFELNIYCNDASAQLVKNCCVLPENIKLHKQVSLDEIRRIMKNADVLLNIGNAIKGYMPSKIFEYIACGKPIISFYTNGLKEQRFDRYPLAIQISQDDTSLEQASQFVEDFCRQFGKKQMNKEEIDLYFPQNLPEKFQYILDNVFGVSV
jgi:glycosyltransferase involved in cell wall biosynthesis